MDLVVADEETKDLLVPVPKPSRRGKGKRGRRRKSVILRITRKRRPKKKYHEPESSEVEDVSKDQPSVEVDDSTEPYVPVPEADFSNLMILADAAVMRLAEIEASKTSEVESTESSVMEEVSSGSSDSSPPPPKKRRRGRKCMDEVLRIDLVDYYG